jgi:hypothetical protein
MADSGRLNRHHRFRVLSAKEFDRDLRRCFLDRVVNFLGCIGQAVRIDVDAHAAPGTLHVFARFQPSYALFKVMTATRTLKFDYVSIATWHQESFVSRG